VKRFLFSSIIKGAGQERPSIKPYPMRDIYTGFQKGKERFHHSSSSVLDPKTRQLLREIEERERYVKQITDKKDGIEKEAYEEGFAQGEKAGMELGEKRFESVIKSFTEALEGVERIKEELYKKSEQEMLALVLAIARRVIQKEVSTDKEIIPGIVRSTLKYVADQEDVRVRLNPSDLEFACKHKGNIIEGMKNVIFEGDEGVSRGDAVIESKRGVIDCGLERHLQKVEENLRARSGELPRGEEEEEELRGDHVE